ncbi:amidohydrolase family protein [Croceibacterium sp. TMG7-5b_MA50]|uniref:amidohydrolase family protein n=1 Tax=Croceibacterium sp. TMG7-5b_MA50 TaxID=3121290 RepID=UPI0032221147
MRLLAALLLLMPVPALAQTVLIRDARVFDGTGTPAYPADVLVQDGRIAAVGPDLDRPRGAVLVRARGMTLIPGLHDLHTHLRASGHGGPEDMGKAWLAHLLNGVTTVNDYSVSGEMIGPIRALTARSGANGQMWAPHLNLAVRTGVPGGHGTEYGWGDAFTLKAATARAAHRAMERALPYKPDVIKAFTDGWRYGRGNDLNDMNVETLAAMVADAHAAGVPVVTHTVTYGGAMDVARAGADAVVHGVADVPVDDALIDAFRQHGTAYVATLAVYEPQAVRRFDPAEWAGLPPAARAREERARRAAQPAAGVISAANAHRWQVLGANMAAIRAAGIPAGIGTDAGIGGVYHGQSAVREVALLVERGGYSAGEALVAATATSAAIMGQADGHGTIAPGMRADLVLVDGRPDQDIADLWHTKRVWLSGREVPLTRLRRQLEDTAMTPMPVVAMTGPIWTQARSDGRTDLGTLPVDASEAGADHSRIALHQPGTDGADGVFMMAQFGAAPQPYAQAVVPLTPGAVALADASGFAGIAFTASGAGEYRLLLETYGANGGDWPAATFTAGAQAAEVRLPFSAFAKAPDLDALRALRFQLNGQPGGTAWLELDDLRFYR